MVFVNISNHPSKKWSESQLNAAKSLVNGGEVIDIACPNVASNATEGEVENLAAGLAQTLLPCDVVLVQGEMTLVYTLVSMLKEKGTKCVAATTERVVTEKDGVKTSVFNFVKFRQYV